MCAKRTRKSGGFWPHTLIQAKLFHPEVLNDSSVVQFVRPLASGAQACTLLSKYLGSICICDTNLLERPLRARHRVGFLAVFLVLIKLRATRPARKTRNAAQSIHAGQVNGVDITWPTVA